MENAGVHANHLVTDRHSMVKKYMRTVHPQKKHYFDVWHMAKGRIFLSKYHNVYYNSVCMYHYNSFMISQYNHAEYKNKTNIILIDLYRSV